MTRAPPVMLTIPLVLKSEANQHAHWRQRSGRASSQRSLVLACLRAHGQRFIEPPCVVVLTRCAPRGLDSDNLVGSAKHARDAVAEWLDVDDRDPRVTWHVAQAKARKGEETLIVYVRERDARDDQYDAAFVAAVGR